LFHASGKRSFKSGIEPPRPALSATAHPCGITGIIDRIRSTRRRPTEVRLLRPLSRSLEDPRMLGAKARGCIRSVLIGLTTQSPYSTMGAFQTKPARVLGPRFVRFHALLFI